MDNLTNLQLIPLAPQCLECGGQILHPTPPPFRIDFASGAITNTRRDGDFSRILSGNLCEPCRLGHAKGTDAYDSLAQDFQDLYRVRGILNLGSESPALQRFTWEITDTHSELQGATLTSYGVWCVSSEPLPPGLTMRSLCYGPEHGAYLCIIFALEILSFRDHNLELHSRWDPDSGDEWQEIRNAQPEDLKQKKRLLDAMELTWEARKRGRPSDSRTFTLEDLESAYRRAEAYDPNPAQAVVAAELDRSTKSIRELLKDLGMDWQTFKKRMQTGA